MKYYEIDLEIRANSKFQTLFIIYNSCLNQALKVKRPQMRKMAQSEFSKYQYKATCCKNNRRNDIEPRLKILILHIHQTRLSQYTIYFGLWSIFSKRKVFKTSKNIVKDVVWLLVNELLREIHPITVRKMNEGHRQRYILF